MTDYICARWRDAVNDPPPDDWIGYCATASLGDRACWFVGDKWLIADGLRTETVAIHGVVRWLDITDEPAVPRAAVQEAVEEMNKIVYMIGSMCEFLRGMELKRCQDLAIMKQLTGITPPEE